MAAGIVHSGNFSQLTSRDYTRVAYEQYALYPPLYEGFAKMDTADGKYIREGEITTFGRFPEHEENAALDFQVPRQGNNKTQYFTEFELGYQLSRIAREDDRQGVFVQLTKALSDAAAWTREVEFWNLLNNGFVNTYDAALDGFALFYDSHTNIDGADESYTTYDNSFTGALSFSTLQTMVQYFRTLKNNKGRPIVNEGPKILLIPPALEDTAKELLLSPYKPYTGDNQINVMAQDQTSVSYRVIPYLTSTTAYFMAVSKGHDLRFINRRPYTYEVFDDGNTGAQIHKGHMRFACTFFDPRLVCGSTGV